MRHWWPGPDAARLIREHLERQRDLPADLVRLDTGRLALVGEDAEGEADEYR